MAMAMHDLTLLWPRPTRSPHSSRCGADAHAPGCPELVDAPATWVAAQAGGAPCAEDEEPRTWKSGEGRDASRPTSRGYPTQAFRRETADHPSVDES